MAKKLKEIRKESPSIQEASSLLISHLKNLKEQLNSLIESTESGNIKICSDLIDKVEFATNSLNEVYSFIGNPYSAASEKIIPTIVNCIRENAQKEIVLDDGNKIEITPEVAVKLARVHDELNEENRGKFCVMLGNSLTSYKSMLHFCDSQTTI